MKCILRFLAWIGQKAHEKLLDIEEREARANALPPGTLVTIKCPCPSDHAGTWKIDEYIHDAGDYRIIRVEDGKRDFASREVMELVP